MSNTAPDDGATRHALRRLAGTAGDTARLPDVADLHRRASRRRRRMAVTGSAALVAFGVLAVPVLVNTLGPEPERQPVVAGAPTTTPAAPPTGSTPPSASGAPAGSASPTATGAAATGEDEQPATEPSTGTRRVQLFLLRERAGQRCPQVVPVTREVPAQGVAKQALRALLDGPTPAERAAGYTSAFDADAGRFRYLKLDGRSARADFTDLDGVLPPDDSCEKTKLLEPMRRTLEQFSWIDEARFSIRGDQRAFYVDVLHDQVPR